MKFYTQKELSLPPKKMGKTVILINKFLWLPTRIGREIRWLEYANLKYYCNKKKGKLVWEPIEFLMR